MDRNVVKFVCPCCGYPQLDAAPYANIGLPPWSDHGSPPYRHRYGEASYDVCRCCGFEFGSDDEPVLGTTGDSFTEHLRVWISGGCPWFQPEQRPADWSLEQQLRSAGIHYEGTKN